MIPTINAAAQMEDSRIQFGWFRTLIALRKAHKVISEGRIEMLYGTTPICSPTAASDQEELLVVCNLTGHEVSLTLPEGWQDAPLLLGNYPRRPPHRPAPLRVPGSAAVSR